MLTGVVLLNFGEPAEATRDAVVPYLERIFYANAAIEGDAPPEKARERARQLAERRAGGLIEEYEEIGGSPLKAHAQAQADELESALGERGYDVVTYLGMQYTDPFIRDAVEQAHEDGVDRLIGLPVYPLCGPSTTVDSLREFSESVAALDWDVDAQELSGWHRNPAYTRFRTDAIREFVAENDVSFDSSTQLVFSAHGTPEHYLDEGSRYQLYVEEYCETVASMLGVDYELGYQNHANRDVPWTEPEVEDVIEELGEREGVERVVVDPISFMHEQSETLSELDIELREEAAEVGLDFYRVPIPYDDDRFISMLGDLVEPFVAGFDPEYYQFRQCQCRDVPGTMCLNAPRGE